MKCMLSSVLSGFAWDLSQKSNQNQSIACSRQSCLLAQIPNAEVNWPSGFVAAQCGKLSIVTS